MWTGLHANVLSLKSNLCNKVVPSQITTLHRTGDGECGVRPGQQARLPNHRSDRSLWEPPELCTLPPTSVHVTTISGTEMFPKAEDNGSLRVPPGESP